MQTDTQKLIPVYTKLISGLYHLEISLNLKRVWYQAEESLAITLFSLYGRK